MPPGNNGMTGVDMTRILTLLLALTLAGGCGGDPGSPEEALRAWVERGEIAAEEKDRGALLDMISVDYADGRGNNLDGIGDLLRIYFFRQQKIALLTSIDDIALSGETAAIVNLTVGMAGTNSGALGLSADAYRFELELEKNDDEWLLIGARWGELGGELH